MSTLIMSAGIFCSETSYEHSSAYFDLNDTDLYSSEFDLNLPKDNPTSDCLGSFGQSFVENNNLNLRDNFRNNSSPASLPSTGSMNSFHCQAALTPSLEATAADPQSSASLDNRGLMSSPDALSLNQGWTTSTLPVDASVMLAPISQNMNNDCLFQGSIQNNLPLSQSYEDSQHLFEMVDSEIASGCLMVASTDASLENKPERATFSSGFPSASEKAQSSFDISTNLVLSFPESSDVSSFPSASFDKFSSVGSPSSHTHSQSSEEMRGNSLGQLVESTLPASPYSFPFEQTQSVGSYGADVMPAFNKFERNANSRCQSLTEFPTGKQSRPTYSEDFFGPSITPPSHHLNQDKCESTSSTASIKSNQLQWSLNFDEPQREMCMENSGVGSNVMSPGHLKKTVSYGSDLVSTKPEFVSQAGMSMEQDQDFGRFASVNSSARSSIDTDLNSPSISANFTYDDNDRYIFSSPQTSPGSYLSGCQQNPLEFSQHPHHHDVMKGRPTKQFYQQPQFSNDSNTLTSYSQDAINQDTFQLNAGKNVNNRFPMGLTTSPFVKPQSTISSHDLSEFNSKPYVTNSLTYQTSKSSKFSPSQRTHPYSPYGSKTKSPSTSKRSLSKNSNEGLLCAVCGDNAACQHYGVRTCEGCKGFFKRTVQRKSSYVCLANKNCPVDKRRRNRCQFCRFEKCLAVGMVKEVVRTDDLKGRRGRLPSKAKGSKDLVVPPSPPVSFITSLVRAHIDTDPSISITDMSQYRTAGMPPSSPIRNAREETKVFYELLASCLQVVHKWAAKIPGFSNLNQEDQTTLIEGSFLEIFALRSAYRYETPEGKFVFCNGLALHRDQLYPGFGEWTDQLVSLGCSLSEFHVDISSFSSMLALLLFKERPGLQEKQKVEKLQAKVVESLREHSRKSAVTVDRPNFFMKLLSFMPSISAVAACGSQRLRQHSLELNPVPLPSCLERSIN